MGRKMRRRRWFAAPLVITTAAIPGCSSAPKGPDWYVNRNGTACTASTPVHCPRNATCNPPPPHAVTCPDGMGESSTVEVDQNADGTCTMTIPGCTGGAACTHAVDCPTWEAGEKLQTLRWLLEPAADGKCTATPSSRTNFGPTRPPVIIDCPPDGRVVITRKPAGDDGCLACATGATCDPAASIDVACPPDTK
jgi:hypothetical protein